MINKDWQTKNGRMKRTLTPEQKAQYIQASMDEHGHELELLTLAVRGVNELVQVQCRKCGNTYTRKPADLRRAALLPCRPCGRRNYESDR